MTVFTLACGEAPPPVREAPVEDEWSRAPAPAWLVATHGVAASHRAECAAALGFIDGDEQCLGAACENAAALASTWTERCPKIDHEHAAHVKELAEAFATRSKTEPTACDAEATTLLREGCMQTACLPRAQAWATRCAAPTKSPLTVRFVERLVERKTDAQERLTVDVRSCDELGAEVLKGAACRDQFACGDAFKMFAVVRERCSAPELLPTTAVGAAAVALAALSEQKLAKVKVRAGSPAVGASDAPLPLADGSGVVVSICGARPPSLAEYVAATAACKQGALVIARSFKVEGGFEVRLGSLAYPDEATFFARFPTLRVAGELELRDREAAAALGKTIAQAASAGAARGGTAAALRELRSAFDIHAEMLRRATTPLANDDALAPLFADLGRAKRAKIAGSAGGDAVGLLERGRTRPLADVDDKGAIKAGATSIAGRLDARRVLPAAMRAYVTALDPGGRASPPRVDAASANKAERVGLLRAGACGDALKRLQAYKAALISCAFELEACGADKRAEATAVIDDSRAAAASAWDAFDVARTGAAHAASNELASAATAAGCREPWW